MKYLHALNKISGIGPQRIRLLLNFFHTPENAWRAGQSDLVSAKIGEKIAERILRERNNITPEEEWEGLSHENIKMITINDSAYPRLLKEISNPPYVIYIKGELDPNQLNSMPSVAIIGSRKHTSYGSQVTLSLSRGLAQAGIVVVSGMALGIDSFAHRGALEGKGKTVAVLGNSLDDASSYPRNNFNLSREIMENGLLVSEYPPVTSAGPLTFPARNRIIAGLTFGTLVIEAGDKSGALLTANMALEYNREVYAVPGSILSTQSSGTNDLIKNGAKTITSVKDILEELDLADSDEIRIKEPRSPGNKEEEAILKILSSDPLHIDNIAKLTKLNMATVSSTLSVMEIKGWIKNIGGQNYTLL